MKSTVGLDCAVNSKRGVVRRCFDQLVVTIGGVLANDFPLTTISCNFPGSLSVLPMTLFSDPGVLRELQYQQDT